MEPTKIYLKPIIIIGFIVVFIFLLILLVNLSKNNQKTTTITPTVLPSPTSVIINSSVANLRITNIPTSQVKISPTLIPISNSTGVNEENLMTQAEKTLVEQKTSLRKKTPFVDKDFSLNFNYGNDKFIVNLSSPKETTKKTFTEWLQKNYPAIPIDRFVFN